jgi:hypothetical protein
VLLAPASASSRRSGGGSLVDRISQQWPEGEGAPAPRSEAVRLARDAEAAAVAEEQEAKRLEREIDPQEAARLEKRLAALGAAAANEPADRLQLRDLLSRQLDLCRGAQRQIAAERGRRDRLRQRLSALQDALGRPASAPAARRERLAACLRALREELAAPAADTPTQTRS